VNAAADRTRKHQDDLASQSVTIVDQLGREVNSAVGGVNSAVADMKVAIEAGAGAMAEKLGEAFAAAEHRQRAINERTGEFIEQIRLAMTNTQVETHAKLQSTFDELSTRIGATIEGLSNEVGAAADRTRKHQEDLASQSVSVVDQLGREVSSVVDGVKSAVVEMKAAVEAMHTTTSDVATKMNAGADTLAIAADDFAKAGQGVSSTLERSSAVANQLSLAAASIAGASQSLNGMVVDYQSARDTVRDLVQSLQALLDQARREASVAGDVLQRIEGATARLIEAQRVAEMYLESVSDVIGEAHTAFTDGMTKAVSEANRGFHQQLSDSVKLLRECIEELAATVEGIPAH
jgi:hypothetical protein